MPRIFEMGAHVCSVHTDMQLWSAVGTHQVVGAFPAIRHGEHRPKPQQKCQVMPAALTQTNDARVVEKGEDMPACRRQTPAGGRRLIT